MATSVRVDVRPEVLRWACERAGSAVDAFVPRFPALASWYAGKSKPTLKQLESFAKATHAPVGYLFLPQPPEEALPIPDFRTLVNAEVRRPSPNLLETIQASQRRQEWFRDHARLTDEAPLGFVGSARLSDDVVAVADRMRTALRFDLAARKEMPSWADALRAFIDHAEAAGVLVMVSGIVGNDTHRKLRPSEFRGFALVDAYAPLIFVNGADSKAAQMFTLAHELAHVWLGQEGLSNVEPLSAPAPSVESWCNAVAAELLVPLAIVKQEFAPNAPLREEANRLARRFKVSTLVVLRRIRDLRVIVDSKVRKAYQEEVQAAEEALKRGAGGDFYRTQGARLGERFIRAVAVSALEGQITYTEAFRLLGVRKASTFDELARRCGVDPS